MMKARGLIGAGVLTSLVMGLWVGAALAQENAPAKAKKAKETTRSPLLAPGLQADEANYTEVEKAELKALEALVRRFSDSAESYRKSAR
jgi:hypothetical protein